MRQTDLTPEEIETLRPYAKAIEHFLTVLDYEEKQLGMVGTALTLSSLFASGMAFGQAYPETALYWVNILADIYGEEWVESQQQTIESYQQILAPRYELP